MGTSRAEMQKQNYRRTVYEIAQMIAPGWERHRARIEEAVAPVRDWMITQLGVRPGDTVLELAAGAGDTGFEAAAIAGERGRLISTDFSPEMVKVARRRGAELGLRNVEYRVVDAEHTGLDADSVDGVLCRFAYMLMEDPAVALAETRRVLRPGRLLTLSVWGAPESNPWITTLARLLVEAGHLPPPKPGDPDPFSMASEECTRGLFEDAGFTTVRTEEVPVHFGYSDIDDFLSVASDTSPFGLLLRQLPGGERATIRQQLGEAFAGFAVDGGYRLPGLSLNAVAS
ncbi:MAG TPA: methyltransferase domain-containing protein [Pyrinomonadaceae bacterium]|nr:methyltransferase domain-containing protein [Pyrinomonadaceae bacterium]